MNRKNKISIIIPVFNVERYLKRCIDSVVHQTYSNIEVILVDDGSSDNSGKICDSYANDDNRVIVVHKKNGGLSDARNFGIRIASGDYMLFVDSDDYIELDSCRKFMEVVSTNSVDLVVGRKCNIDKNKEKTPENNLLISGCEYMTVALSNNNLELCSWLYLYNLKFWKEKGFEFKTGIFHEDLQLTPRVLMNAQKVYVSNIEHYHYIQHSESITNKFELSNKRQEDIEKIMIEWIRLSDDIQDERLSSLFKGLISKTYVYSCALNNYIICRDNAVSPRYLIIHAINGKERLKQALYVIFPKFYLVLFGRKRRARND